MVISAIYKRLRQIAEDEFGDIVVYTEIEALSTGDLRKLRLIIVDGSFVDVFVSVSGRYSYHWQRTAAAGGALYRHDNAPHASWRYVSTYPKHFHQGTEQNVVASHLGADPTAALPRKYAPSCGRCYRARQATFYRGPKSTNAVMFHLSRSSWCSGAKMTR